MTKIDRVLLREARRPQRKDGMSLSDCVAANVLWRDGVPIPVLVKVFKHAKNTLFYNAFTGDAPSYPKSRRARDINGIVDRMGVEAARAKYVTWDIIKAVNEANAARIAGYRT